MTLYNNINYTILEKFIKKHIINVTNKQQNNNNYYKSYFINKLYNNKIFKKNYIENIKNIELIDNIFESRYKDKEYNISCCSTYGVIKNINCNKLSNICFTLTKYYTKVTVFYKNFKISKNSLIWFPLTCDSILGVNGFIQNINKYILCRTNNLYISNLISLFYYFMGLFLSLFSLYLNNNIKILYSNLIIISKKLSNFVNVKTLSGLTGFYATVVPLKLINILNNSLYLSELVTYSYCPHLIGITNYVSLNTGILSKLSFQNTLKTINKIILHEKFEWKVDSKSNIILSDFIPAGSGWYRYFINI